MLLLAGLDAEYPIIRNALEMSGVELMLLPQEEMGDRGRLKETQELILKKSASAGEAVNTVIVFSHAAMDLNAEEFFRNLPCRAAIVPIGAEALLLGCATVSPAQAEILNRYFLYNGMENIQSAAAYIRRELFGETGVSDVAPPAEKPLHGILSFETGAVFDSLAAYFETVGRLYQSYAGLLIHRHNWVHDNLAVPRELAASLQKKGIGVITVFSGANTLGFRELADRYFKVNEIMTIDILINNILFLIKPQEGRSNAEESGLEFERLGVPVISPVQSFYITAKQWEKTNLPINADMPGALIAPEMAGMIEPVLIGVRNPETGKTDVLSEQADYLARKVRNWITLRKKSKGEKKLAIILHNSVCTGVEATIGKSFGLDAFESIIRLLARLEAEGYHTGGFPRSGVELWQLIMEKKAFSDFRWTSVEDIVQSGGCLYRMPLEVYHTYYRKLPQEMRASMEDTWGSPPGEGMVLDGDLIITGLRFGNVAIMVQPKRGCYGAKCTGEVCKILHDPACPPPHQYLATYRFIQRIFQADAIVDMGTDGSLEYLPGKINGLSQRCWPQAVLGDIPSVYVYNAGVTNEALIVKRRLYSVVVDHLPPPSVGTDEQTKRLGRTISDYFRALELGSGQDKTIKTVILSLLEILPVARRIIDSAEDFDTGLGEVRDAINTADQGRKISRNHIFGAIPGDDEIENFIREVLDGEETEYSPAAPGIDDLRARLKRCDNEMDMLIRALDGGYIPAGESGMPDENGRNILPTGRNMFGMNVDKIPTPVAYERGKLLAEQLLESYRKDEGRLPEKVAMNMISLDITRSNGEQLSQFLYLLGVEPLWDKRERVTALRILDIKDLGRPRIDVTVRISGVLRDTWPMAVEMMDEAVLMVSVLDETDDENFLRKHLREYRNTEIAGRPAGEDIEKAKGESHDSPDDRNGAIRIFGDAPGTYGANLDLALLASAWNNERELVKYFIQASAYAYGRNLNGSKKIREFVENARNVDASCDTTSSRRMNVLACNFGAQVQGGYRLLAKHLGGRSIRQYQSTSEPGKEASTESLAENLLRTAQETLLNPFWKENMLEREYDGASDIMHMMQSVFSSQCLTENFPDAILDTLTEAYINDEEMRQWFSKHNTYALEEISRRMLELYTRGKWKPQEEVLLKLKENYLSTEGDLEEKIENSGEIQGGNIDIFTDADVDTWKAKLVEVEEYIK